MEVFPLGIDIDLRRLRFFVEVVRQRGFSQAARVLFATQPTVSKAVKQLEDELGAELLDRTANPVQLTDAGRIVYERGRHLLAQAGDLGNELDELRGLRQGTLRLGFGRMGTTALFADVISEYRRRYPAIGVDVVVREHQELLANVRSGGVELALAFGPVPDDLDARDVLQDRLVALLPTDHALAERDSIALRELQGEHLMLFDEGSHLNDDILAQAGGDAALQATAFPSQADLLFELVAAGGGVAFMPSRLEAARPHRRVRAVALQAPGVPWVVRMAWRRGAYLSHAARAWIDIVSRHGLAGAGG